MKARRTSWFLRKIGSRARICPGFLLITVASLACGATSTRQAIDDLPTLSVQSSDLQGLRNEFPGEEEFGEAAMAAPSFAGFYHASPGSDTLVVAVSNMRDAARARDAVANIFARKNNLPPGQVLSVRKVRYTFLQLHRWRKLVEPSLRKLPEVTMIDLDEGQNTVTVGVARGQDSSGVRRMMSSAGLPSNAYRIVTFGPIRAEPELVKEKK